MEQSNWENEHGVSLQNLDWANESESAAPHQVAKSERDEVLLKNSADSTRVHFDFDAPLHLYCGSVHSSVERCEGGAWKVVMMQPLQKLDWAMKVKAQQLTG